MNSCFCSCFLIGIENSLIHSETVGDLHNLTCLSLSFHAEFTVCSSHSSLLQSLPHTCNCCARALQHVHSLHFPVLPQMSASQSDCLQSQLPLFLTQYSKTLPYLSLTNTMCLNFLFTVQDAIQGFGKWLTQRLVCKQEDLSTETSPTRNTGTCNPSSGEVEPAICLRHTGRPV